MVEAAIENAWNAYKENFLSIFVATILFDLIISVPITIAVTLFFVGLLVPWLIGLSLAMGLLAFFLVLIFSGGYTAMLIESLKRKAPATFMFTAARELWAKFFFAGFVAFIIELAIALIVFGPSIISGKPLVVAASWIIFIPISILLNILLAYVYIIAAEERIGARAVLLSMDFARKNFWDTFLLLFVFGLASLIFGALMSTVILAFPAILVITFVLAPLCQLSLAALYLAHKPIVLKPMVRKRKLRKTKPRKKPRKRKRKR